MCLGLIMAAFFLVKCLISKWRIIIFFNFCQKCRFFLKLSGIHFQRRQKSLLQSVIRSFSHSVIQSFGHSVKLFALLQKYSFRQNSSSEVLFICQLKLLRVTVNPLVKAPLRHCNFHFSLFFYFSFISDFTPLILVTIRLVRHMKQENIISLNQYQLVQTSINFKRWTHTINSLSNLFDRATFVHATSLPPIPTYNDSHPSV